MDFRHLIVTCLFSMLRLPFDNQKVKENYAIFYIKQQEFLKILCPGKTKLGMPKGCAWDSYLQIQIKFRLNPG